MFWKEKKECEMDGHGNRHFVHAKCSRKISEGACESEKWEILFARRAPKAYKKLKRDHCQGSDFWDHGKSALGIPNELGVVNQEGV